jgi:nucleoside-diphosphate-sugar epimerase
MKVFVTGATGYIGEAVVGRLVEKHDVRALVRSQKAADFVQKLKCKAVLGDLADPTWKSQAAECDVIVSMAAADDYRAVDKTAILAMIDAAKSSNKPRRILYTSGCLVLGEKKEPAGEDTPADANAPAVGWRALHEQIILKAAGAPVSTAVIRPGWVFGGNRGAFNDYYFASAEKDGASIYHGSGEQRWPLVHREDLAELYALLVERWHEGMFHAVNESTKTNLIATAASLAAGKQGQTRSIEGAPELLQDQVMIAPRSKEVAGWKPKRAQFIDSAVQMYKEWKGA